MPLHSADICGQHTYTHAAKIAKSHTSFYHQFSKQQTNTRTKISRGESSRRCRNTQSSFHYKTEVHRTRNSRKGGKAVENQGGKAGQHTHMATSLEKNTVAKTTHHR